MSTKENILEQLRKQKNAVSDTDIQARKRAWLDSLSQLFSTLSEWTREAEEEGLLSRETYDVLLNEQELGIYSAPAMRFKTPSGNAIEIRPRGTFIVGGHGRVDWESSTGKKAMLVRTDPKLWQFPELLPTGRWAFQPLSEDRFWEVIERLLT